MRLPKWLRRLLPCSVCRPVRQKQTLRIQWPLEVFLDGQGAAFVCHRCGRTGKVARETIPRM